MEVALSPGGLAESGNYRFCFAKVALNTTRADVRGGEICNRCSKRLPR